MSDHLEGDALVAYRVEQARKAHGQGLVLMPVKGKVPVGKGWQKQPAPSLETVEAWARAGNLGLRTGAPSGVFCIDDDTEDHSAAASLGLPISTPTIITGSGHPNRLYRAPLDFVVHNNVEALAPHVDVRADRGMVVFPGSLHPDTGKPYVWADGLSPDDVPFAELPPELLDRLRPPKRARAPEVAGSADSKAESPQRGMAGRRKRYAEKALRNAVRRLASAPEHTRNVTLNKEAFGMGRLVGAGWLHEELVRPALDSAARSAGLPDAEIAKTMESGLTAGVANPVDDSILRQAGDREDEQEERPVRHQRPTILISGGDLPDVVSASEKALLALNLEPFFERAGFPMRIVRHATAAKKHGINRPAGALALVTLEAPYLVEAFMHAAVYEVMKEEGPVMINCPEWVARHYLARRGLWHIPHLEQVIEVPIMRRDGTLLTQSGYDAETEMYLDAGALQLPAIPDKPTIDDARRALAVLKEPIEKFPFIEDSDRSAALAAMLTVLVRPSIRTAPLFAFRAPKMASGKSLLADVIAMLATGRVAPVMTPGKDDEEMRKRLTAFLLAGFPLGCIDNVEQPFGGEAICSVLTQGVWRDRILGKSEMATLPTCVVWTLTGNNVVFVGDITTRVVVCDLDPRVERPEERKFDVDLHTWVPANRARLVAAGLTVLRAYHVAGRPAQGLTVFGRFEEWSEVARNPLAWLGEADPCLGIARIRDVDPVREQVGRILGLWHEAVGEDACTVADVILRVSGRIELEPFSLALAEVARGERGNIDPRRLGNWLAKVERRVERGLQVVRMGTRSGAALWAVRSIDGRPVSCVSSVSPSGSGDGAGANAPPAAALDAPDEAMSSECQWSLPAQPASPKDSRNSRNSRGRPATNPAVAADDCSHVTDHGHQP